MWPFKKRVLPPPPIPEPISPQSAVVHRITNALHQDQGVREHLFGTRPAILVARLEKVGTATGNIVFHRDRGMAINWVTWLAYDPHAKKRPREAPAEGHPQEQLVSVELQIPTSPIEQVKHSVVLHDDNGNIYILEPTRPLA